MRDLDRSEHRSDRDGCRDRDLEDAEHASEHVLVDAALEEGEAGDVEQRVADTHKPQAHECPAVGGPGADERDRRAPEHERAAEHARQPAPARRG